MLKGIGSLFKRKKREVVPVVLQQKQNDCAIACLSMLAQFHKLKCDLNIQDHHSDDSKGISIEKLISIANSIGLTAKASKVPWHKLQTVAKPCILFWRNNHYVVLISVLDEGCTIHDPSCGKMFFYWPQFYYHYSHICVELSSL